MILVYTVPMPRIAANICLTLIPGQGAAPAANRDKTLIRLYNKFRLAIANKYMYDSLVIITQQFKMNTVMMRTHVLQLLTIQNGGQNGGSMKVWCVLVSQLICGGQTVDFWWSVGWVVLVSRLIFGGQPVGGGGQTIG